MRSFVTLSLVLSILTVPRAFGGTTGKIAGTAVDARTGEKLVSANVVVEGLRVGATTNVDGYFAILNIPPGVYKVQASLLGYTPSTQSNVRVEIDQTTDLRFRLSEEAVEQQEVTVIAERPVVRKDVSNSRANIAYTEVQKLPVATVAGVVGLQAGIQSTAGGQFVIRGGGVDQTAFMVNGQSLRDGRDNTPYTGISLTSIEDIQIQTGGWNAEYGNIRSGLVNVVTRDGSKTNYSFSIISRYRAPDQKHFGTSIYDPNSYWLRPYLDPDVCWTGTGNGAWDEYMQRQYPTFTGGWNAVARTSLANNDPTKPETYLDDLTPEAARQLFLFQHRKRAAVTNSDYDIDMSFGGPIPLVSEYLGNLRFFASYRRSRSMYLFPLSDDAYRDYHGQLKLTADIGEGMKFTIEGLMGQSTGTNDNNSGLPGLFTSAGGIVDAIKNNTYLEAIIFGTDYYAPSRIKRNMVGGKFTHVLTPTTFYDVSFNRFESKYETNPGRTRDSSRIYKFGNAYYVDESPYGFPIFFGNESSGSGIGSRMNMAQGWSGSRDTSVVATYNVKFDMSSQLDRYNLVQAGAEVIYTDNRVNYGSIDLRLHDNDVRNNWATFPWQASLYVQDKIEFEGMIANLGVRVEYANANGKWFSSLNPYDDRLGDIRSLGLDSLLTEPTKKIITVSPRLGIAFPISDNSKVFFNYGHFRSLPTPEDMFLIRRKASSFAITRLANPNNPFPRTVSYELGYEQSMFDQYLVRVAGYYKDVSNEQLSTYRPSYISDDGLVNYSVNASNTYRDIRGFELTLSKNRGDWFQGFVNYTYDVRTSGYFGYGSYYEDKQLQRNYIRDDVTHYQNKPVPQPYARANVDLFTPEDYGPEFSGIYLLGDWRVNFVASWSSGSFFSWAGGGTTAGAENNVQWKDSWNVNSRISKNFRIGPANIQLFADISNLFNFKQMGYQNGFAVQGKDFENYMKSLHLPSEIVGDETNKKFGYPNIPGEDRPGDYRKDGVAFTPMVSVTSLSTVTTPAASALYHDLSTGRWMQYANGAWSEASSDRVNQVLEDKAYIDMPNLDYFSFLNPRNIFYGIRLSYDF